jgi:dipeptidyl aminopeptidase/acylaminoacyl peptidase
VLALLALAWAGPAPAEVARSTAPDADLALLRYTTAIDYQHQFHNERLAAWRKRVPRVRTVQIRSSMDGEQQRALWYDSGSRHPRPLLVVLHSWSADYRQNLDIPFAEFAIQNDWAFLHPDFRGPNRRPQAAASPLAIQDVLDAVKMARERGAIDPTRIYLVGYSGGAMKALVLAAKHPELWAGVASWGGVYDIPDWFRHNKGKEPHYVDTITASCGGAPNPGTAAEEECRKRSPSSQLAQAAGKVPILIAHGIADRTVPPRHAVDAFDALAAPDDRFSKAQRDFIDGKGHLPPELENESADEPLFDKAGAPVRLERHSQAVTLVLYQGGHDMLYNASLDWLARQRRRDASMIGTAP